MNATTSIRDTRLIFVSLRVAGARRPLRALLGSGTTNNFFRATCLSELPTGTQVKSDLSEITMKLAVGRPQHTPRHWVTLSYGFDGFRSCEDFLVINLNASFDCNSGMPWCMCHKPDVDWLDQKIRQVGPERGIDVGEVLAFLQAAPENWPHVIVVDSLSMTLAARRAGDNPLCNGPSMAITWRQMCVVHITSQCTMGDYYRSDTGNTADTHVHR